MGCLYVMIVAIIWQVNGLEVELILSIPYNDQDLLMIHTLYFHLINLAIDQIMNYFSLDLSVNLENTPRIVLISHYYKYLGCLRKYLRSSSVYSYLFLSC